MRPPLSRIPLLPAAIGVATGIVFSLWLPEYVVLWCIIAAILSIILIWRNEWWIAMTTLAVIPGTITAVIHNRNLAESISGEWEGEIVAVAENDRASAIEIEVLSRHDSDNQWTKISPFKVRIFVPSPDSIYTPGQYVRFDATLCPPSGDTDLPYQISERDRMLREEYAAMTLITQEHITSTGHHSLRTRVAEIRTHLSDILLRSTMRSRTKEFLTAALFGHRQLLAPDTLEAFNRGGVSHVLAISGLHVGILLWIFSLLLVPVRLLNRRSSTLLIIAAIWLYALLTGFSPSVTRAVVMVSMVLAGKIVQRTATPFNSLLLAFIIILLVSPLALFNIGFQMSFCAVASILLFTPHINRVSPRHRVRFFISSTIGGSLAATLSVGIISAYYFHTFPLLFLISNLVLAIVLPPMLTCGVAVIMLSLLGIPTEWLCYVADALYHLNSLYLQLLEHIPLSSLTNLYFPGWIIVIWIVGLIMLKLRFVTRRRFYGYCTAILLVSSVVLILLPYHTQNDDNSTHIYFQRQRTLTTIIVERPHNPQGSTLSLISSAVPHMRRQLYSDFIEENQEWITRHDIKEVRISDTDTIIADDIRLLMIHQGKSVHHYDGHFTHAVICRGFTGTLEDICDSLSVDTLILSYDMHPKVFNRIRLEAEESGWPYISLKDSALTIHSGCPVAPAQ